MIGFVFITTALISSSLAAKCTSYTGVSTTAAPTASNLALAPQVSDTAAGFNYYRVASTSTTTKIVIALHGQTSNQGKNFCAFMAGRKSSCRGSTTIYCPDFAGTHADFDATSASSSGKTLEEMVHYLVGKYGTGKSVVFFGYSQGAQGLQRLSMKAKYGSSSSKALYVLGCASSFAQVSKAKWNLGVGSGVPFTFSKANILAKNSYKFICGANDIYQAASSGVDQGCDRITRMKNLIESLKSAGFTSTNAPKIVTVKDARHTQYEKVLPAAADLIC